MAKSVADRPEADQQVEELYSRPGFLIRRANQIAVSLFLEESADLSITTTQYGTMTILSAVDGLDQIGLAKLLGIDRSTAALVVGKLEAEGHVSLAQDPRDRRRKVLALTAQGAAMLDKMVAPAERARRQLLSAFTEDEQQTFLRLLEQFVETLNHDARAPLVGIDGSAK